MRPPAGARPPPDGAAGRAHPIGVGPTLAPELFDELRRAMELEHCKWDAQVGDETTLAPFPLVIAGSTWRLLADAAEQLARETLACEAELGARPDLQRRVGLPRPLCALFAPGSAAPTPAAYRVMRFDFHWTTDGWRVSEVNSDVPGGFAEAGPFATLVAEHTPGARPAGDPGGALVAALERVAERGVVALLSAPGYLEDHQVVALLARRLRARGLVAHLCSPRHLRWREGRASLDAAWYAGPVDAVVRFYQAEWLATLRPDACWAPLFSGGRTPVGNPGSAALSESKRLPLAWGELDAAVPAWRRFAPEASEPAGVPWLGGHDWVLKRAFGNNGDDVSMRSAMTAASWAWLAWRARSAPESWVAQRRFRVAPVDSPLGPVSPCLGVYTVDGRAAGLYGRLARGAVVDHAAIDVAVLVGDESLE